MKHPLMVLGGLVFCAIAAASSSGWAEHMTAHGRPSGAAASSFPPDFDPPTDEEWGWPLGGFGGKARGEGLKLNPVIFVHGNGYDSAFWDVAAEVPPSTMNVRRIFREAGYSEQEIWAVSYNGRGCSNTATCGTANDVNTADITSFIEAVRLYTGATKVDVVAHSLGVTIVRKAIRETPVLLDRIEDLVLIAGANHGTSSCEGLEGSWFGCDEIAPGSAWLSELNSWDPRGERDETPGPVRYLTIYEGTGTADTFFLGDDADSPALSGADNRELPGTLHLPLARGQESVDIYLPFVKNHNELEQAAGPGETDQRMGAPAPGSPLASTGSSAQGWGAVLIGTAFALSVVARRLKVE